jgi:asparagine synthase (glutamine-hydrolysing)
LKPVLNDAILPEFLATRYVSGEETFFRGVRKLLPAHTLTWSQEEGGARRRYWQIPAPAPGGPPVKSFDATAADLRDRLREAVRRHLMSDVPLGVFLSGGLDSTALAGIATEVVGAPLQTFSVGFEEAEANELPYARLAARRFGAEHRKSSCLQLKHFAPFPV